MIFRPVNQNNLCYFVPAPRKQGPVTKPNFAPVHPRANEFPVTLQAEIDLFLKAPDIVLETQDDALPLEAQSGSAELAPQEQGGWLDYFYSCSTIYEDMCFPFSLLFSGCLSVTPSYGVGIPFSLDSCNCTSTFARLLSPSLSLSGWVLQLLISRSKANHCSLSLSGWVLRLLIFRSKANHCVLSLSGSVLRLLILRSEANPCSLCLSRWVLQLFEYRLKANHCSLSLDGCYDCWYTGRRQISVLI